MNSIVELKLWGQMTRRLCEKAAFEAPLKLTHKKLTCISSLFLSTITSFLSFILALVGQIHSSTAGTVELSRAKQHIIFLFKRVQSNSLVENVAAGAAAHRVLGVNCVSMGVRMLVLVDRAHSDTTDARQVGRGRNKGWFFCANKKKIKNRTVIAIFYRPTTRKKFFLFYLSGHS